jgi:hypothetical protein
VSLTEGTFNARGVTGALGMSSTGKEQVAVDIVVSDPGFEGEHITWYGYFTEGTIDRTFESLRHLGWQGDDLRDLSGIDRLPVRIVVAWDSYTDGNGKTHENLKVKWINAPGGLALKQPLTEDQAKSFASRMRAHAVASRAKMGQAPAPAAARPGGAPPPSPADDDIPFGWLLVFGLGLASMGMRLLA